MRRADAAGREKIVIPFTKRIDGRNNLIGGIWKHARFTQINSNPAQIISNIADVLILCAARKNLIANHEHRRRDGANLRHLSKTLLGHDLRNLSSWDRAK